MKSKDKPVYVNMNSNHPTPILKNIPLVVNRRLSKISANATVFNEAALHIRMPLL
jgi:hypothetical protein